MDQRKVYQILEVIWSDLYKQRDTPNRLIEWIQVGIVWGPHVRLDERDVLTPSLIAPLVSGVAGSPAFKVGCPAARQTH